jgi:putative oxygen-independent coproporphyrinogen III oxidase
MPEVRHVYAHVPFCARRCSYCDFSIAVRRTVPVDEYVDALGAELALRFPDSLRQAVDTLYLGGGTPSKLGAAGVARTLDVLRRSFPTDATSEVTLEANPEDVTDQAARAWRQAGVGRVSLGAQSFDDDVLRWMHRTHDAGAIARAVAVLRAADLAEISLDLIFALPPEIERSWERDLDAALALDVPHISLYGLTVEPHTPLARWRDRGTLSDAPDERYEDDYLLAHRYLVAAGYLHYEVSNFGRPGHASRHNSSYWTGAAYAGVGPAAHGFDGRARRWNTAAYAAWVDRVSRGVDPVEGEEILTPENRTAEAVYLGLRTSDGLPLAPEEFDHVRPWIESDWASERDGRLILSALGWLRLDAIATDLTARKSPC